MANLDTRSKRASSVQILMPWVLAPPGPDGTIGAGDRQHIALSYSGVLAGAAVVVTPPAAAVTGGGSAPSDLPQLWEPLRVFESQEDIAELIILGAL